MSFDAVAIIASLHHKAMLRLESYTGQPSQGLQQGSRQCRQKLGPGLTRKLRELDIVAAWLRHLSQLKCEAFLLKLDQALAQPCAEPPPSQKQPAETPARDTAEWYAMDEVEESMVLGVSDTSADESNEKEQGQEEAPCSGGARGGSSGIGSATASATSDTQQAAGTAIAVEEAAGGTASVATDTATAKEEAIADKEAIAANASCSTTSPAFEAAFWQRTEASIAAEQLPNAKKHKKKAKRFT